jgi:hypothetical protein
VSGATPTIADQGNVSAGNNKYVVFPSIDINSKGDIGMTYLQSGGTNPATAGGSFNEFMSMYITGRRVGDAAGTMQTPVLVKAGTTNTSSMETHREGDLSGINVDSTPLTVTPAGSQIASEGTSTAFSLGSFSDSEGNFWAANEWADGGGLWKTNIGQFSFVGAKGPWSVDVDWGDGGSHDTFSVTTPDGLGSRTHTYGE